MRRRAKATLDLGLALRSNSPKDAENALQRGADPNAPMNEGRGKPLCYVLRTNQISDPAKFIRLLLDHGAEANAWGETPVFVSSVLKRWNKYADLKEILQMLVDAGLQIDGREAGRRLFDVLDHRDWKFAEWLIDHGVELTDGGRPLVDYLRPGFAGRYDEPECEDLLMRAINRDAPLGIIEKIYPYVGQVRTNRAGENALHMAISNARDGEDVFSFLMGQPDVDVNAVKKTTGETPLHVAIRSRSGWFDKPRFCSRLIKGGADMTVCDNAGVAPLDAAVDEGERDVVGVLLHTSKKNGLRLDLERALLKAAKVGKKEIVQRLIEAGAEVNAVDKKDGMTPLMHTARGSSVEIVDLLVKAGAETGARDNEGHNAFYYAQSTKNRAVVTYLSRFEAANDPHEIARLNDDQKYRMISNYMLEVQGPEEGGLKTVFNFWTRQIIYQDPKRAEAMCAVNFNDVAHQPVIQEARNKLVSLGGTPPPIDDLLCKTAVQGPVLKPPAETAP